MNKISSKRKRVFAASIDLSIVMAVLVLMFYLFGFEYISVEGQKRYKLTGFKAFLPFIFWFVSIPLVEGIFGQTLGKKMLGIKVVSIEFNQVKITQSIIRHILDIIDWLPGFGIVGLLVASNNKNSQRLGDIVAKTIVVESQ